jgi:Ctr copper transporter family
MQYIFVLALNILCVRTFSTISDHSDDENPCTSEKTSEVSHSHSLSPSRAPKTLRIMVPFTPAQNIPRGAIHALQALLGYFLMLAVMYVLLRRLFVLGRLNDCFFDLIQDIPGWLSRFHCHWIGFGRNPI